MSNPPPYTSPSWQPSYQHSDSICFSSAETDGLTRHAPSPASRKKISASLLVLVFFATVAIIAAATFNNAGLSNIADEQAGDVVATSYVSAVIASKKDPVFIDDYCLSISKLL